MTTQISRTSQDLSVFFQNLLENLWESDVITTTEDEAGNKTETERKPRRDWSIYLKAPTPDWTGQLWKGLR